MLIIVITVQTSVSHTMLVLIIKHKFLLHAYIDVLHLSIIPVKINEITLHFLIDSQYL